MFSAFAFSDSASQINAKIQRGLFLFAVSNSCVDPIVYGQSTTMASARNGAHTHILIQSVNPALCVVVKCRPNWKSKNVVVFSDMHSRADEYSYCHLSSQWFCFFFFRRNVFDRFPTINEEANGARSLLSQLSLEGQDLSVVKATGDRGQRSLADPWTKTRIHNDPRGKTTNTVAEKGHRRHLTSSLASSERRF